MPNPSVPKQSKKAFYLFLCSVLGVIIFTFIHQSFWIAYVALARLGYLPQLDIFNPLPSVTLEAAFLLGMWYGIWLGLYWYEIVYERAQARWFYAFAGGKGSRSHPTEKTTERLPWQTQGQSKSHQANASRWRLEDLLDDSDDKGNGQEPQPPRVSVVSEEVPPLKPARKGPGKPARARKTPSL